MRRQFLHVGVAGIALALLGSPAQAAGTVHYDYTQPCYTSYVDQVGLATFCYSSSGQYQQTVTPSGNQSYVGQETSSFSMTTASSSHSESSLHKYHFLFTSGEVHVRHEEYSYSNTTDGKTCTVTVTLTFANGEMRHDRATNSCP